MMLLMAAYHISLNTFTSRILYIHRQDPASLEESFVSRFYTCCSTRSRSAIMPANMCTVCYVINYGVHHPQGGTSI